MTNAYILISDLHLADRNIRSRVDYRSELSLVFDNIDKCIGEAESAGADNVILIFLGDIFDRGYKNVQDGIADTLKLHRLAERCTLYTVVGNHELTYYRSNPFYSLINSWETTRASSSMKYKTKLLGDKNVLHTPDTIEDGNVTFYFNHNGLLVNTPKEGETSIGLFHMDYHPKLVTEDAMQFDKNMWVGENAVSDDIVNLYNYCFFGHMHKLHGIYGTESGTTLCFLGSLGRTNVSEVNENTKRLIPTVFVKDGNFDRIDTYYFDLPKYSDCVNTAEVEKNKQAYEELKKKVAVKTQDVFSTNTTEAITELLMSDPYTVSIMQGILNDSGSDLIRLSEELKNV